MQNWFGKPTKCLDITELMWCEEKNIKVNIITIAESLSVDGTPEAVITEHRERPKKRARMRSGADWKDGKIQRWREAEMRKGQRGS